MEISITYPGGFCETVSSMKAAERLIKDSRVDEGELRKKPDGTGFKFEEYREFGPDGPGWYFAGRTIPFTA